MIHVEEHKNIHSIKVALHLTYYVKSPITSYRKWPDKLRLPSPPGVIQNKAKMYLTFQNILRTFKISEKYFLYLQNILHSKYLGHLRILTYKYPNLAPVINRL
jgi:hypothetical protein